MKIPTGWGFTRLGITVVNKTFCRQSKSRIPPVHGNLNEFISWKLRSWFLISKNACCLITQKWNENKIISNLVQVRKHQLYRRGPRLLIRHKHSTSDPKKISTTNVLNKKHGDFTKTKFLEWSDQKQRCCKVTTRNGQTPQISTS